MNMIEAAKYFFMALFILFFVLDIITKKSYKIYYYLFLTIAVTFTVIGMQWHVGFKAGFIVLFALFTVKTIVDERKSLRYQSSKETG